MLYSDNYGSTPQGVSLNNNRRLYDFSDKIAEIYPNDSVFFYLLSKLAKQPTNDPIFKMLEQRHQYQRGNFDLSADQVGGSATVAAGVLADITVTVDCDYDVYGRKHRDGTRFAPQFFKIGDDVVIETTTGYESGAGLLSFHVVGVTNGTTASGQSTTLVLRLFSIDGVTLSTTHNSDVIDLNNNDAGQLMGNAFAEGSGAPDGWSDKLYDREGYTQIFKTACPMFTGTSLATELRGISNEYMRVWAEKLKEHKMAMAQAFLFSTGAYAVEDGVNVKRRTHGIIPYVMNNGGYVDQTFSYANSGYDTFMSFLLNWLEPEAGLDTSTKVVLASRKIINWLNKLGTDGFLTNTLGSEHTSNFDVIPNTTDEFGFKLTKISTVFGDLLFYNEALLRGPYDDYMCIVDMSAVRLRPLVGNGISRDTYIKTNIQDPDADARKDMILTEAGLQIDLPEKHAVITFS